MIAASRAACEALDREDPLGHLRERFALPAGVVYLDGNSLGALPKAVPGRLADAVHREWGEGLVGSWTAARWIEAPARLGDRLARLIGAGPGEVVVADSTSVDCFKLLVAALRLRPGRRVVLSERANFPTDLYVAQGAVDVLGAGHRLRLVGEGELIGAIDAATAVVLLTHVDFKSGRLHDLAGVTAAAHRAGALALWDLSHSVGALPLDVTGADVDLAIGCTYKYLNGGPGSPAFAYVARRHQAGLRQPLSGWMGHAAPFAFAADYRPAEGIGRILTGTPPMLSMLALEAALDVWDGVDLAAVRAKSMALGRLFVELVEARLAGAGFRLASPREPAERGSHVVFAHPDGYAVMQALIARGVIGDFRAPDLLRFGFTPLYLRFVDVWDAVEALAAVVAGREWDRPAHRVRKSVT